MEPPVRSFRPPFEMGLKGMTVAAIVVAVMAIALFLTDVGVVNW
jgi:hypothetical protein